jgi:electron transport complex protein RnfD
MIPVGTPLWLSGVGAAIATLLGKLLFGGFHHMVFHSSLVGYIFLTEGWTALLKGVEFSTAFDNYLINLLFNNSFFNEVLYIGRIFGLDGPLFDVSSMETVLGQVTNNSVTYSLLDTMIGAVPGVLVSGILLLAFLIYLIIKKAVNYVVPVTMIGSFLLTVFLTNGFDVNVVLYHLFSGAFLFVVVFVSTDFITTPIPSIGKVIFGIVAGSLTVFIRNGANYEEGVVFGVLFMMMLTPMMNTMFKKAPKKKVVKKAPVKEGA